MTLAKLVANAAPALIASLALSLALPACSGKVVQAGPLPTDTLQPDAGPPPKLKPDAGPPRDAGPLEPISFPRSVSSGGPVIANPKIVPIVFNGDTFTSDIGTFTQRMGVSAYWKETATEYGVGPFATLPTVVLDEAAPAAIDDSAIKLWLQTKLADPQTRLGAPDDSTLYALYYPKATTITLEGSSSCQAFGGYHNETTVGAIKVAYAVMPRCSGRMGDLESLSIVASHEYFEWATDPFPFTAPAYQQTDEEHIAWAIAAGGELSDLCTTLDFGQGIRLPEIGYSVQRQWSNLSSLAGHHPCIPSDGTPYVVAVPEAPDMIVIPDGVQSIRSRGVSIPRKKSRDVRVRIHTDGPATVSSLPLRVVDMRNGGGDPPGFTFSFSSDVLGSGEIVTMTVEADGTEPYAAPVLVIGDRQGSLGLWPCLVEAR
jgi:hypothetical protein